MRRSLRPSLPSALERLSRAGIRRFTLAGRNGQRRERRAGQSPPCIGIGSVARMPSRLRALVGVAPATAYRLPSLRTRHTEAGVDVVGARSGSNARHGMLDRFKERLKRGRRERDTVAGGRRGSLIEQVLSRRFHRRRAFVHCPPGVGTCRTASGALGHPVFARRSACAGTASGRPLPELVADRSRRRPCLHGRSRDQHAIYVAAVVPRCAARPRQDGFDVAATTFLSPGACVLGLVFGAKQPALPQLPQTVEPAGRCSGYLVLLARSRALRRSSTTLPSTSEAIAVTLRWSSLPTPASR